MSWKIIASAFSLAGVCCLISASGVLAQGPPKAGGAPPRPGGPGGFGGFQMTPEQQKKAEAWKKWTDAHKGIGDLQTMLRKVERLDKEPGAELNKAQATKLLAIIDPWRTKKEMTNDQANGVMKSVSAMLTPAQVTKLATMQGGRGGGPGGFGGGGRPGGPGGGPRAGTGGAAPRTGAPGTPPTGAGGSGPGGAGRGPRPAGGPGGFGGGNFTMPDPPKNGYNPLNPDTLPFEQMRPRAKKNLEEFTAALQAKAK